MPIPNPSVSGLPKKGETFFDAEDSLYVRVTRIDSAYIHYEGDADGYARHEEFSRRFERRPASEADWLN